MQYEVKFDKALPCYLNSCFELTQKILKCMAYSNYTSKPLSSYKQLTVTEGIVVV